MTGDLAIRRYAPDDRAAVERLWRQCGLSVPWNDAAQDIGEFHDRRQANLLVGVLDDKVVATAAAAYDGHRGWLYYVAVAPNCRRHGFAGLILRAAEDWLGKRGARKIQLTIRPANHAVRQFYAAIGYHAAPRLVMQRWLQQPDTPEFGADGDGMLDLSITHLELRERPQSRHTPRPPGKLALIRADPPTIPFYRYLYDGVGEAWFWWRRRVMPDAELAVIIQDPLVEVYVLHAHGVPAGFAELDLRRLNSEGVADIAYLGLMPEFIGRGYGRYLLDWSVDAALRHTPRRVMVKTCNLDHPRAVAFYQKAGFVPLRQEARSVRDPRVAGVIPPDTPLPSSYAAVSPTANVAESDNVTPILRPK